MAHSLDQQSAADFHAARRRAFFRAIETFVRRQPNKLLSFEEVREKLRIGGQLYRGVRPVLVSQIVGSVGRYRDFDRVFLPKQDETQYRWRSVDRAFYQDIHLPPVHLYQIGDVYFVLDGNHRVSVARQQGLQYIDAEVIECRTRVPVTTTLRAEDLDMITEQVVFLERTRLDQLRPDQSILITEPGGYRRLLEHIAVHRYYMGLELQRDIGDDEAVMHWYDTVYYPLVEVIREQDVLRLFPGRTETDLYLWVIDHQHYLREHAGDNSLGAAEATADYAGQFGSRGLVDKVRNSVSQVVDKLRVHGTADSESEDQPTEETE